MNQKLAEQLDGLLEKYTELLIGEGSEENKEKIKAWILYNHVAKSMPALAKHWNASYPEGKEAVTEIIKEIKRLNEENRRGRT